MRKAFSIALLILTLLPCAKAYAEERCMYPSGTAGLYSAEEIKALWERDADAALMGEAVLKNFRKNGNTSLKLNAFCSLQSMIELDMMRDKLLSIIESAGSKTAATDEEILAALLLVKAASADITGLILKEESFIQSINSLPVKNRCLKTEGFAGRAFPRDEITLQMPGMVINLSGSGKLFIHGTIQRSGRAQYELKINPGRNFETVHADYYRLFLYMRDDAGDSSPRKPAYTFPPDISQLFNQLNSFRQNKILQHIGSAECYSFLNFNSITIIPERFHEET